MKTIPAFWYGGNGNAGDMVTPWLIRACGAEPRLCGDAEPVRRVLGCGSILAHATAHSVVWGTGIGERQQWVDPAATFRAVRGPISRQRVLECGGSCPEVYGDPAMLLPRFYAPRPAGAWRVGVVPHFVDYEWARQRAPKDALVIDILRPIEAVVDAIMACDGIVSSSLHGLVFASAYGLPVSWARMSDRLCGDGVKFHDFWRSFGHADDAPRIDLTSTWPSATALASGCKPWGRIDLDALWQSCPIRDWPGEDASDGSG